MTTAVTIAAEPANVRHLNSIFSISYIHLFM
jgi:hypothetical protein